MVIEHSKTKIKVLWGFSFFPEIFLVSQGVIFFLFWQFPVIRAYLIDLALTTSHLDT